MAKELPQTVDDLLRKASIKVAEIVEAGEPYLPAPKLKSFHFASGDLLHVTEAVEGHQLAKSALLNIGTIAARRCGSP